MTRKILIGAVACLALVGCKTSQPVFTVTPPPLPPGMQPVPVGRVTRAAVVPVPTAPRTNEVSVAVADSFVNTRRMLQSKLMSGGNWQTIANRGTNFAFEIPKNLPDSFFRAVAVRTNTVGFAWEEPDPGSPVGDSFWLHSGRSSRNYTNHVKFSGAGLAGAITNLPAGLNYVAVTKVSSAYLQSTYSNEVVVNVSPLTGAPPRPTLSIR